MKRRPIVAAWLAASLAGAGASGHGMIPRDAPIDRLVQNLGARIKEHPEDPEGYYVLGRCHALVYEYKNRNVKVFELGDRVPRPATAGWLKMLSGRPGAVDAPADAELREHLVAAIENLNTAIRLDPSRAKYHLALASVLEAGAALAGQVPVHPLLVDVVIPEDDSARAAFLERLGRDDAAMRVARQRLRSINWEHERVSDRDKLVALFWDAAKSADANRAVAAKVLLAEDWQNQITDEYFRAMSLALPDDGKIETKPIWGSLEDWVSYEAAKCYIRAVEARGVGPDEKTRLSVAEATVKAFDNLPESGAVTPVIFRVGARSLGEMTDPIAAVPFDLDGSGRPLRWSWVRPDTVILAWDPARSGRIESGRQLFGNATWWLLFRDGYEALDALDDNRDGRLAGPELQGLAGWRDADGDGVSDPGEVLPLTSLGVSWVSCRPDTLDDDCLASVAGVGFVSGEPLPSVDWIATIQASESVIGGRRSRRWRRVWGWSRSAGGDSRRSGGGG